MSLANVIIYLTIRLVVREDNDANKVRTIFDDSAKINGPSINEYLYKGPQLAPLIFDTFEILEFRDCFHCGEWESVPPN